jgi:hypothetical protein
MKHFSIPFNNPELSMIKIKYFAVILILVFVTSAQAQDYNDALRLSQPGILTGARAFGMGNAYTALSSDLSAAVFNPAGFAQIKNLEFDGSINFNSLNNNTTFFSNQTNISSSSTNLSQFGFVFPVPTYQGSMVFAFGFSQNTDFNKIMKFNGFNPNSNSMIQDLTSVNDNLAYDLGLSSSVNDPQGNYIKDTTSINGRLNQSGKITQEGRINTWFLSGAFEIDKDIFVGATLDVISGTYKSNSDYYEDDINNVYANITLDPTDSRTKGFQSFYMNTLRNLDLSGWDARIGILAKLNQYVNIGATIKFPRTYTIKDTYTVSGSSTFANNGFVYGPLSDRIEYDVVTPYEFTIGGAFTGKNITISADVKLIDYSQMEFTNTPMDAGIDWAQRNQDIKDSLTTVININVGAEYTIPNSALSVRGGFMYEPSAFRNDPSSFNKKYFTLGLGYDATKTISFNVAYAYGWWKDYGDNYSVGLSRTFQDINISNAVLTFKYNF